MDHNHQTITILNTKSIDSNFNNQRNSDLKSEWKTVTPRGRKKNILQKKSYVEECTFLTEEDMVLFREKINKQMENNQKYKKSFSSFSSKSQSSSSLHFGSKLDPIDIQNQNPELNQDNDNKFGINNQNYNNKREHLEKKEFELSS